MLASFRVPLSWKEIWKRTGKEVMSDDLLDRADEVNCDIDRKPARKENHGLRASDLIIGAAILAPAAVRIAKEIRERAA